MIFCCIASIVYFGLGHQYSELVGYSFPIYWLSMAMALVSTILPTYMIAYGIQKIGSGDAAIVNSAGPISTIIQAYFILGESVGLYHIAGTVLVLLGIWMIGTKKQNRS